MLEKVAQQSGKHLYLILSQANCWKIGALDAMDKPQIVASIAGSLVSPNLASRKVAAEILVFFCHWDASNTNRVGLGLVINAFDQLEQRLNLAIADLANKVGRFDVWMKQLEQTIDGRGRMGSMVGVSNDLKGTDDGSIMDYCVR